MNIKFDDVGVESSGFEKLIGIKINSKFSFKDHLDGVIKKASRKVNVLSRKTPYMNVPTHFFNKRRNL